MNKFQYTVITTIKLVFLITSVLVATVICIEAKELNNDLLFGINQLLIQHVDTDNKSEGIAVGIYENNKISMFTYGLRDKKKKLPVQEDTLFEIGSIGKVFTGILLADQIYAKKLDLNDPIQKYLPDSIKAPIFKKQVDNPITFQHLTTHTSGLPRLPANMGVSLLSRNPYAKYSRTKLYKFLNSHSIKRAPAAKAEYSNVGVGLLGQLLVDISDLSYAELLQQNITKPLALADTVIKVNTEQETRFSQGYAVFGAISPHWDFQDSMVAAGGIGGTIL